MDKAELISYGLDLTKKKRLDCSFVTCFSFNNVVDYNI